jgi:hypothetical protein
MIRWEKPCWMRSSALIQKSAMWKVLCLKCESFYFSQTLSFNRHNCLALAYVNGRSISISRTRVVCVLPTRSIWLDSQNSKTWQRVTSLGVSLRVKKILHPTINSIGTTSIASPSRRVKRIVKVCKLHYANLKHICDCINKIMSLE